MSTLILSSDDVRQLITISEVIEAVEQAFKRWATGEVQIPTKSYLVLNKGDFRAMPAALKDAAGIKWVSVYPENISIGLPTVMALLIYNDPETGYPLAIMDATEITAYRTGAASAIASKYLARKNSRTLGIIGAGRQAYTQLLAHMELFSFEEIRVFDLSTSSASRLIMSFPEYPIKHSSITNTAACDIICTLTPARKPILKREWIKPGTHINAVGADAEGKEELEPEILREAIIVVDEIEQASVAGEINVPLKKGLITIKDIYGTLGDIITGQEKPRESDEVITVFDSTGIAFEDIAVAKLVYEKAKQIGTYLSLNIIEGSSE